MSKDQEPGKGKSVDLSWLGCLIPVVLVYVTFFGSLQWKWKVRGERNAAVEAAVDVVVAGLARYARGHGGKYPAPAGVEADLAPYLPGGRLPLNPWKKSPMPMEVLGIEAVGADRMFNRIALPGAAELAASKPLPAPEAYTYCPHGTLIYDCDPPRRVYVVYGIGAASFSDAPDGGTGSPVLRKAATNARHGPH